MKLRLSLKNSARRVLLISSLLTLSLFSPGCSSSTSPTYLKETVDSAIREICKKEYNLDVITHRIGETVWVYIPVQDLLIKRDKPEKIFKTFEIEKLDGEFLDKSLRLEYSIKNIPRTEEDEEYKFNEKMMDKFGDVWKTIRRVLFSTQHQKEGQPKFFCTILVDTKKGIGIRTIAYYEDIKKVSYELISYDEYQHRSIQDVFEDAQMVGDEEGARVTYFDVTMKDFVAAQIYHRIKLKFQKPEADKNADIDKEILKIVVYVFKTYNFGDFDAVDVNNTASGYKVNFNKPAILEKKPD